MMSNALYCDQCATVERGPRYSNRWLHVTQPHPWASDTITPPQYANCYYCSTACLEVAAVRWAKHDRDQAARLAAMEAGMRVWHERDRSTDALAAAQQ